MLAVLAVVALAIGNAWYVINRYIVHQIIDYICYRAGLEGPAEKNEVNYIEELANYTLDSFYNKCIPIKARQHVEFRASSVLLIYIISELLLFMAIWSEPHTITHGHKYHLIIAAISVFGLAIWQNIITRRIDAALVHKELCDRKPEEDIRKVF